MAVTLNASTSSGFIQTADTSGQLVIQANGTNELTVLSTGVTVADNLLFNSGYGSAAIAYGCRAWVNFNGTGTVAIRASGNVTSITDNGTGDYTVNFTTAMPDANYSTTGFAWASNKNCCAIFLGPKTTTTNPQTTTTVRVATRDNISETILYDADVIDVSIFR